ncbi:hypothetical protein [Gracilibacillus suaedae]|uniref:hypothetical protein n=1 Tax=Gracilibacillus suaedae TaxID=2820273 RepID=UPI001ABE318A|nr:hypothetical protein [Gracilibacillus suaedae]
MKKRIIAGLIVGITALVIIGFTVYKVFTGKDVGFNEIISIAIVMSMFFSTITWGTKEDNDGIFQDEELGKKITEKSSKISYFLLMLFLLGAVMADELVNGTINIFLLLVLGLSMITLPFTEYLVAKKYE